LNKKSINTFVGIFFKKFTKTMTGQLFHARIALPCPPFNTGITVRNCNQYAW